MLINGAFSDALPASDRGLQYGDGLFETIAIIDGKPRQWQAHMARLASGCEALQLPRANEELLRDEALQLTKHTATAVLKIIITRGSGGRGYRFPAETAPTRILSIHPWPDYPATYAQQGIAITLCKTRLGCNPALAGIKHLNRLEQVLARNEWQGDDIQEGLMLDHQGYIIEGTMSNLFMVEDDRLVTADLSQCGVKGVMRETVIALAQQHKIPVQIEPINTDRLKAAPACFVTNSLIGLWPVRQLDDINYERSKITQDLIELLSEQQLISGPN